jgi:hypothetical protein
LVAVLGAVLLTAAVAGSARAQAAASAPEKPTLWLAADSCPSVQVLREMLEPLVSHQHTLRVEARGSAREPNVEVRGSAREQDLNAPAGVDPARLASVRDLGEQYVIEVAGVTRSQSDADRDCRERARVAAVFIALNLQAPPPPPAPAPAPVAQPAPAAPAPAPAPAHPPSVQVGLGAFASVGYAPPDQVAPGGGLELWVRHGIWRFGLGAGVMGKIDLAITPSAPGGHVELMRLPALLSAGPMWRVSRFELGPSLGLAVDLLRAEGQALDRNQDLWRANVGAQLALQTQLILTETWSISGLLAGAFYPRSYDLMVGPNQRSAHTPQIWLAAQLGILCRLR